MAVNRRFNNPARVENGISMIASQAYNLAHQCQQLVLPIPLRQLPRHQQYVLLWHLCMRKHMNALSLQLPTRATTSAACTLAASGLAGALDAVLRVVNTTPSHKNALVPATALLSRSLSRATAAPPMLGLLGPAGVIARDAVMACSIGHARAEVALAAAARE